MKKLLLVSVAFVSVMAQAQSIKLTSGNKITATTTTNMDMDMGMAGQMKIASTTVNVINITAADDNNYKATNTITKMTMAQEGMGQNVTFDSDKKEDRESEIGKAVSTQLDVPAEVSIEKNSGKVVEINKKSVAGEEAAKNPMADIMGDTKSAEAITAPAFFVIPIGKKTGDNWTDSTNEAGLKGIKTYQLSSIIDGIANITFKTVAKGTINKEAQGMQFDIMMNSTGEGTMKVDTKTGLVKSNTITSSVDGTLEMMGQSLPITMKMASTSVFQ